MAAEDLPVEGAGGEKKQPVEYRRAEPRDGGGFFTIYKSGQGYWTRMGTAFGAGLVGAYTAYFLYDLIEGANTTVAISVAAGFLVVFAALLFWLLNKPTNAQFLIETDTEMKKVNWTSRRELYGSTKVVVLFMFAIAVFLFVVDLIFNIIFYLLDVLKVRPPFWPSGT